MITKINHPLIQHKITLLRDKNTKSKDFRKILREISMLMSFEATRNLKLSKTNITTNFGTAECDEIKGKKLTLVPILRSGLEMCQGVQKLIPSAKIGHIGLYRDRFSNSTVEYYCKLPSDISERDVFLLEPLISSGDKVNVAIQFIKNYNVKNITLISLISSEIALKAIQENHPDVNIYIAEIDNKFDTNGYLLPGIGDVAARLYGTL
ncbi:MAG: uracil phosphoribosyltransferase [Clostridia bacterium]